VKIARELEKRLERLVDGISAAVFRGRLHPVDLAERLIRNADLLVRDGAAGPEIPNEFTVTVSRGEFDPDIDLGALGRELGYALDTTATARGWRTGGPVRVEVRLTDGPLTGSIDATALSVPGPIPPWGQLVDTAGGRAFAMEDNRVLIGRVPGTDITLSEPEISRHHAVIFREAGAIWLSDLDSSNGTALNGAPVTTTPAQLVPGDAVTFGPATFTFRLL
jgi:hypothetical protein